MSEGPRYSRSNWVWLKTYWWRLLAERHFLLTHIKLKKRFACLHDWKQLGEVAVGSFSSGPQCSRLSGTLVKGFACFFTPPASELESQDCAVWPVVSLTYSLELLKWMKRWLTEALQHILVLLADWFYCEGYSQWHGVLIVTFARKSRM